MEETPEAGGNQLRRSRPPALPVLRVDGLCVVLYVCGRMAMDGAGMVPARAASVHQALIEATETK